MRFSNLIGRSIAGLALSSVSLALACSAEDDASPAASHAPGAVTQAVDSVDLGDGVTLHFGREASTGIAAVSVSGPASQRAKLDDLAGVRGEVAELHRTALPAVAIPTSVLEFDAQVREFVTAAPYTEVRAEFAEPKAAFGSEDNAAGVAPKSAATFTASYCKSQIDRVWTRSGWYWLQDWCLTNRTGNNDITLSSVRQGFGAIEMYRGSATFKAQYRSSGTSSWTTYGTYTVAQNTVQWVRMWSTTSTPIDTRFTTTNAANDGLHIAVQRAETPITGMTNKNDTAGHQYVIMCPCENTKPRGDYFIKACLRAPEWVQNGRERYTHDDAYGVCDNKCESLDPMDPTLMPDDDRLNFEAIPNTMGCTVDWNEWTDL